MKITRIDTLRLDEFPSLVHVLVHNDEGLVGLGETFFFADAVEAHIHAVADYLVGQDPSEVEKLLPCAARVRGHGSQRRRDAGCFAVDIALWDLCGQATEQPLHRIWAARAATRFARTTRAPDTATSARRAARPSQLGPARPRG